MNAPTAGDSFRLAMRRLAASVTVLTIMRDGRPLGMAATAVCSLSFDPPSILACINRSASLHDDFVGIERFGRIGQRLQQDARRFEQRVDRLLRGLQPRGNRRRRRAPCVAPRISCRKSHLDRSLPVQWEALPALAGTMPRGNPGGGPLSGRLNANIMLGHRNVLSTSLVSGFATLPALATSSAA